MQTGQSARCVQIIGQDTDEFCIRLPFALGCQSDNQFWPKAVTLQNPVPFAQRTFSFRAARFGPVHCLAIVGAQHHQPDHLARHTLIKQVADGKEIAQGFGHLLALNLQHLVMDPIAGKFTMRVGASGLRDFIFMMRELQVIAAAVNIKAFAQQLMAHRGTFNMPARTTITPRAIPAQHAIP